MGDAEETDWQKRMVLRASMMFAAAILIGVLILLLVPTAPLALLVAPLGLVIAYVCSTVVRHLS